MIGNFFLCSTADAAVPLHNYRPDAVEEPFLEVEKVVYTLRVGIFVSEEDVRERILLLRNKGYTPFVIEQRDSSERSWKSVCIGRYEQKEKAQEVLVRFLEQANLQADILPLKITYESGIELLQVHHAAITEQRAVFSHTVEVSAEVDEEAVQWFVQRLRRLGYDPFVLERWGAQGQLWKSVCLGRFANQMEAEKMAATLSRREGVNAKPLSLERFPRAFQQKIQTAILRVRSPHQEILQRTFIPALKTSRMLNVRPEPSRSILALERLPKKGETDKEAKEERTTSIQSQGRGRAEKQVAKLRPLKIEEGALPREASVQLMTEKLPVWRALNHQSERDTALSRVLAIREQTALLSVEPAKPVHRTASPKSALPHYVSVLKR
ncbi:SPOR domain-containing protein [Magnetococcales bacterium HHB-1]